MSRSPREMEIEYLYNQLAIAEEEAHALRRQIELLENSTDLEHEYDSATSSNK